MFSFLRNRQTVSCNVLEGLVLMLEMFSEAIKIRDFLCQETFDYYYFLIVIFYLFIYFYIYFWLCWVFVSVRGLSLVAASGDHSSSWCAGLFTTVASLVAEHRLQTHRLSSCGSLA